MDNNAIHSHRAAKNTGLMFYRMLVTMRGPLSQKIEFHYYDAYKGVFGDIIFWYSIGIYF